MPEYNFMTALEGEWHHIGEERLLPEPPELEKEYEVQIGEALKAQQTLWSVYMRPYAQLNGFESESDISSILFCQCRLTEIMDANAHKTRIKAVVVDVVGLPKPEVENLVPLQITLLEEQAISKRYYRVENYYNFTLIDVNIQSDLGITAIVRKQDTRSWGCSHQ